MFAWLRSIPAPQPTGGADVYAVDDGTVKGVWEVGNILDSTYSGKKSQFEARTLSILVQDVPGVLNMVGGGWTGWSPAPVPCQKHSGACQGVLRVESDVHVMAWLLSRVWQVVCMIACVPQSVYTLSIR